MSGFEKKEKISPEVSFLSVCVALFLLALTITLPIVNIFDSIFAKLIICMSVVNLLVWLIITVLCCVRYYRLKKVGSSELPNIRVLWVITIVSAALVIASFIFQ